MISGVRAIDWDRFAVLACALVGFIVGIAQATGTIHEPFDAIMYWRGFLDEPYWLGAGQYVYPPPMTQLIEPFRWIGWPVFIVGWTTLIWASLGYVAGRFAPLVLLAAVIQNPSTVAGAEAAFIGNVTLPMAAAIVAGMKHPALWAVPLLTKITPGVGVIWFAFRGEWRRFGIAVGATVAIAIGSFVLLPSSWSQFAALAVDNANLRTNGGMVIVGPPLWTRLVAAVLLIAWGARSNRSVGCSNRVRPVGHGPLPPWVDPRDCHGLDPPRLDRTAPSAPDRAPRRRARLTAGSKSKMQSLTMSLDALLFKDAPGLLVTDPHGHSSIATEWT